MDVNLSPSNSLLSKSQFSGGGSNKSLNPFSTVRPKSVTAQVNPFSGSTSVSTIAGTSTAELSTNPFQPATSTGSVLEQTSLTLFTPGFAVDQPNRLNTTSTQPGPALSFFPSEYTITDLKNPGVWNFIFGPFTGYSYVNTLPSFEDVPTFESEYIVSLYAEPSGTNSYTDRYGDPWALVSEQPYGDNKTYLIMSSEIDEIPNASQVILGLSLQSNSSSDFYSTPTLAVDDVYPSDLEPFVDNISGATLSLDFIVATEAGVRDLEIIAQMRAYVGDRLVFYLYYLDRGLAPSDPLEVSGQLALYTEGKQIFRVIDTDDTSPEFQPFEYAVPYSVPIGRDNRFSLCLDREKKICSVHLNGTCVAYQTFSYELPSEPDLKVFSSCEVLVNAVAARATVGLGDVEFAFVPLYDATNYIVNDLQDSVG